MKTATLLFGILLFTVLADWNAIGQAGDVNVWPELDGFSGEYRKANDKLLIEHRVKNSELSVSRVSNSSGQTLVEAVRVPASLTVRVTDVTITFDLNRTNPADSGVSALSEVDRSKLQDFIRSETAATVRYVLASIIRQRRRDNGNQLFGFLSVAMLLGDGPSGGDFQQSSRDCSNSKLDFASFTVPRLRANDSIFQNVRMSTLEDECLGCCGPGCWGCTGCYTDACLAHDLCVERFGATSQTCMIMLAVAVASMCDQCLIC